MAARGRSSRTTSESGSLASGRLLNMDRQHVLNHPPILVDLHLVVNAVLGPPRTCAVSAFSETGRVRSSLGRRQSSLQETIAGRRGETVYGRNRPFGFPPRIRPACPGKAGTASGHVVRHRCTLSSTDIR